MLRNKKAQLTIIIIIAVVLALGIISYLFFTGKIGLPSSSGEFDSVFTYYQQCIEQQTKTALDISGSQGGHMNADFIPGSDYAPFSNQLNFVGIPIPYWYYISSNGVIKQNVPTKSQMEKEIADYVQNNLWKCNFDQFYAQGWDIQFGKPTLTVRINTNNVKVDAKSAITVSNSESSSSKNEYSLSVDSKFGSFYDTAKSIYDKELSESFLENYSVDILRTYAPVDGVELGCSPKVWKTNDVENKLKEALTANIAALKFEGDYYALKNKTDNYFVINQEVSDSINLIYSKDWPTKIEINGKGVNSQLLTAKPVGNEGGFGTFGFCYSPYHFVYDISYPVLIQVYSTNELFQFPVVVVVDKNMPRNAIPSYYQGEDTTEDIDLCEFNTQNVNVNLLDSKLNPITDKIQLSYQCFTQECPLGETTTGSFSGAAPACVNGYLIAKGDNYATKKQLFSSNEETNADMLIDRLYNVSINLEVSGHSSNGIALISFEGNNGATAFLPDNGKIKLSEGMYNVTVYVYENSSITLPSSTKTQCTQVPETGLSALFGATKEQCYEVTTPSTTIEFGLSAGGKATDQYILPEMLEDGQLLVQVNEFPKPTSLEQLQYNYEAFESAGVGIE